MKCVCAQELLDDYVLNELAPDIEMQLNTHLDGCVPCRKALREREECLAEMESNMELDLPASAFKRIEGSRPLRRRKSRFLWIFPTQVVYTLGAFLLGIIIMRIVDAVLIDRSEESQVEMYRVPAYREPSTDTVHFYTAPAKHLARS